MGLPQEFDLKYDSLAKWCVFQGRIRTIEPFIDYESFLRNYIALLHSIVTEFYRYFRISERLNLQSLRVIPPELLESYEKWSEIQKTDVIQSYYANVALFLPHKLNNGYNHRIFLNPCLRKFCAETQRFLCQGDPGYDIRSWVDRFVQKKQTKLLIGLNPVYGTTSSFWLG
ncbi:unnamed protein product [Macrosiphum euphorbiae]|uniref:Maturase K n=1 Tax=Macrosiphum euphorbiae TaxID=13131 RepID=A0AAV0WUH7_9HEMI|nr:unnamed protein product [Macrosiphum euphorbiae]